MVLISGVLYMGLSLEYGHGSMLRSQSQFLGL